MLKKIIQFLSHEKRSDDKVSDSKVASQSPTRVKKELHTAEDFEDAGHQSLKANELNQAELYCRQSLEINPNRATAYNRLGVVLYYQNRLDEALSSYDNAIALTPDYADAYYNRGIALNKMKRLDEAVTSYDHAIALKPDYINAHFNRGITLYSLNRLGEALNSYDGAIALNPDYAEIYNDRGVALNAMKRFDEALASYDRIISLNPDYSLAYNNRGTTLYAMKRMDEALASYDRAIALNPSYAEAYNNRGTILNVMRRPEEALASYDRAIALSPDYAEAYYNRGTALNDIRQLDKALASYDRAIALIPSYTLAYYNRAIILDDLKRLDEALASYHQALKLKPDYEFLYGHWLHIKMRLCDWSNYDNQIIQLTNKIEQGENALPPFALLALPSSRSLQKKAAEIYMQYKYPADYTLPKINKHSKRKRIRIGYFSADFCNHPVSFLTAELFELHNSSKFELLAFSFGPDTKDEMRTRIRAAFDQFIDVRHKSNKEVAVMVRNLGIDIAIDLGGFTSNCRTGIFALRAAPLQVSYLGYLGTMGAEYIDYLIADEMIIPQAHQKDYTEKIVYLPSYQVNDTRREISDRAFTRHELGLPSTGFVFCCFNANYKITPSTFDSWMRILHQVEGSILWLLEDNKSTTNNLIKEAAIRGVTAQRLIFASRLPLPEYLARYRMADLFLDTSPYNAGTTASDALWAGLPILTCLGETFSSRVAASLLSAIQLPELITTTQKDYEALAVEIAMNPDKLAGIKRKLAENRLITPLFDTQQFTRNIEKAFIHMHERYHAGLMPDHIYENRLTDKS